MSLYHYYKIKGSLYINDEELDNIGNEKCVIEIITKEPILKKKDKLYWKQEKLSIFRNIRSMKELEFESAVDWSSINGLKFNDELEIDWNNGWHQMYSYSLNYVLDVIYRKECDNPISHKRWDNYYNMSFIGKSFVVTVSPHDNGEYSDVFKLMKIMRNPSLSIDDVMNEQKEFVQLHANLLRTVIDELYGSFYVQRIFNFETLNQEEDFHETYRKLAAVNFEPDLNVETSYWGQRSIYEWADNSVSRFDDDTDSCCYGLYENFLKFKQFVSEFKEMYPALPKESDFYKSMKDVETLEEDDEKHAIVDVTTHNDDMLAGDSTIDDVIESLRLLQRQKKFEHKNRQFNTFINMLKSNK